MDKRKETIEEWEKAAQKAKDSQKSEDIEKERLLHRQVLQLSPPA